MKTYFDIQAVLVKAKTVAGKIIIGYSFSTLCGAELKTFVKECAFRDNTYFCDNQDNDFQEVICDTTCRSTGFFDKNKKLCFEYDLVEIKDCFGYGKKLGYIYWDTNTKNWGIRNYFAYSGMQEIRNAQFAVIGNVALSNSDFEKIKQQDEEEELKTFDIDKSTCLSAQYKNKKTKQFLPK